MAQYYEEAKELAGLYNQCHAIVTKPLEPVSNMFHVHIDLPKVKLEAILIHIYEATGIGLTSNLRETNETSCYFEVNIGDRYAHIPKEGIVKVLQLLDERIRAALR